MSPALPFQVSLVLLVLYSAAGAGEVRLERLPEKGLQPQVAAEADGTVHLVYLTGEAAGAEVRYTLRKAKETAWRAPVTVNSVPHSAVATGTIRGPQIALGKEGSVHVVWNGAGQKGNYAATPLYYSRLAAGSAAFAPQVALNAGTIHLDGGASVAAADGAVYVTWHAAPPEGKGEGERRVYLAVSVNDGVSFAPAAPAAGAAPGVCPCCSLTSRAAPGGALSILYRSAEQPGERGMMLLSSTDGGRRFSASSVHPWAVAACPMSSAALAGGGRAAWETEGVIYTSATPGKSPALAVSEKGARHPAVAVNSAGETLIAWSTGTGWQKGGGLAWRQLDAGGGLTEKKGSAGGLPVWGSLAVFAAGADFVVLY